MEDLEARITALLESSKKVTDDLKELLKATKKVAKEAPKEKKVAEKPKKEKKTKEEAPAAAGGSDGKKKKSKAKESDDESSEDEAPASAGGALKPAKAEKRFTRMSGPTLKAFEKALGDKMSADHKKQFADYVNGMDADKFASMALEKHMEAYASTLDVQSLTIIQLRAQKKDLSEVSSGVYRNSKTGKLVTGPPEMEDEEYDDGELDGVKYLIGQDTQRVHRENSDGADGPFEGYWGIGKFADADL
jgi:hypothetical protein